MVSVPNPIVVLVSPSWIIFVARYKLSVVVSPLTSNLVPGDVVPIPTLPLDLIVNLVDLDVVVPVWNSILCGALPLDTVPSALISTPAVALPAPPSYITPNKLNI